MSKIIRTSNLYILQTWLIGGEIDSSGNCCEGFNSFNEDYLTDDILNNFEEVKNIVIDLINNFKDDKFEYYNEYYKFKMPPDKNLEKLTHNIIKEKATK